MQRDGSTIVAIKVDIGIVSSEGLVSSNSDGSDVYAAVLTTTSDQRLVDFRRMPVKSLARHGAQSYTLDARLTSGSQRIVVTAACDSIPGTAVRAELRPVLKSRPSFIPSESSGAPVPPASKIQPEKSLLPKKSKPQSIEPRTKRACKHNCKKACRHPCCNRLAQPSVPTEVKEPANSRQTTKPTAEKRYLSDGTSSDDADDVPLHKQTKLQKDQHLKTLLGSDSSDDEFADPELDRLVSEIPSEHRQAEKKRATKSLLLPLLRKRAGSAKNASKSAYKSLSGLRRELVQLTSSDEESVADKQPQDDPIQTGFTPSPRAAAQLENLPSPDTIVQDSSNQAVLAGPDAGEAGKEMFTDEIELWRTEDSPPIPTLDPFEAPASPLARVEVQNNTVHAQRRDGKNAARTRRQASFKQDHPDIGIKDALLDELDAWLEDNAQKVA